MGELAQVLSFNYDNLGLNVRVIILVGEPWFVAKDCDALAISKVDRAVAGLDEDEKGAHIVSTLGGKQNMTIVSEAGL